LAAYLQRAGGSLTTFVLEPNQERDRALAVALAAWASAQPLRRAFQIATIDTAPAAGHPLAPAFRDAGFVAAGGGLLLSLRGRGFQPEAPPDADFPENDEEIADAGG
jgi:hypothetical protein